MTLEDTARKWCGYHRIASKELECNRCDDIAAAVREALEPYRAVVTALEEAMFEHEKRHHYGFKACKEADCGWPARARAALVARRGGTDA